MASSKEYLEYVLEQLSEAEGLRYRPMMGEYLIYCRNKLVGGVYDDRLLVKPTKAACALLPDAPASVLPLPASADALAAGPDPRRDVWRYQRVDMARLEGETLAGSSFDAAAAFAAMDDPPTWFVALRRWLEACGDPAVKKSRAASMAE